MSDSSRRTAETPNKRRLSLRLGGESSMTNSDKKARIEQALSTRSRDSVELTDEIEQPRTATSTRFTHSSYSSPTSSNEGDREKAFRDRFARRQDDHTSAGMARRRRPSYTSTWVAGENERGGVSSGSTSRQQNHPSVYQSTPSASLNASRHSSPPPSFNLSSGQPLVNPPPKTQAAFVGKLYSMLEDDDIVKTGLIYWSAEGTTFTCPNPQEFSKIVLPRFFKHNNWQSFVRQLNMYSFNKVNDIYTTSVDPQAWEFRHSLFRRGEPHLLASIKRKSSRPNANDGQPISPTEELAELSKPVAGWMREPNTQNQHPTVLRLASPPQKPRNIVYPYSGPNEDSRPTTTAGSWEHRQSNLLNHAPQPITMRMPPPLQEYQPQPQIQTNSTSQPQLPNSRFHPDPNRPPLSAQRFLPPAFPDSPYHNQTSQHSPRETPPNQINVLEDRLQRLTEILNNDRIEHIRYNLDFTSYLMQMVGWAAGDEPSMEMKALKDTLNRQNADMRQKYEALMASDALAIMASGGGQSGRERESERDRDREERRSRYPFEANASRTMHATLPTPRLPPANNISRGVTPLPSPSIREFGEAPLTSRPPSGLISTASGEPYPPQSQSHSSNLVLPLPLNLSKSSNPNISYFPSFPQSSGSVTPTVNGLASSQKDGNHDEVRRTPGEEPRPILPAIKSEQNGFAAAGEGGIRDIEEMKTKAGLKNLLN